MRTKKGLEMTVLVSLIVGLVAGIFLLAYLFSLTGMMEQKTDIETCRLSMIANSKIKGKSLAFFESPIRCPAEKLVLAYPNHKNSIYSIRQQMKDCWYKTGEGKLTAFGRNMAEPMSSCLVCSEFILKEDLNTSLIKESLLDKMPFSQLNYLDYFTVLGQDKSQSPDIFFIDVSQDNPKQLVTLKKDTPHFILFIRQSQSNLQTFFSPVSEPISNFIAYLIGTNPIQDTQTFFILPREQVSELSKKTFCKDLYWEQGKEYVKK